MLLNAGNKWYKFDYEIAPMRGIFTMYIQAKNTEEAKVNFIFGMRTDQRTKVKIHSIKEE